MFTNIKHIIFDFDGLLVNSESLIGECWMDTCSYYQIDLPEDFFKDIAGVDRELIFKRIQEVTGSSLDKEVFFEKRQDFLNQRVENGQLRLMPGVEVFLAWGKEQGFNFSIASSSYTFWVKRGIDQFGLGNYFEGVLGKEDVRQVKPDPELYLKTLELYRLSPDQALIFEDSLTGFRAALQSGVKSILINDNERIQAQFKEKYAESQTHYTSFIELLAEFDSSGYICGN